MPIYLYWGDEDFNVEFAVKKLRKSVLDPDWAEFNHKTLREPSIRNLLESITTIPMGFGNSLIEVYNSNLFSRRAKADNDKDTKQREKDIKGLLEAIESISDRIHLVFIEIFPKNTKRKIDKTLKTTKAFTKFAKIQQFESIKSYDEGKAISWIKDAFEDQKVNISHDAAKTLFETVGTDLRSLNSEINKLVTYTGKRKKITAKDVDLLCSSIENIFILSEYWVKAEKQSALLELKKLMDKDHPIKILATLQTMLTQWLNIKLELQSGTPSTNLAQKIGVHPFVLKKTIQNLKYVSPERLSILKDRLTQTEYKIKTGEIEAELGMEILMTI